jgi:ElaB/YqjD/DUF883 family membrane-anchored ribosome-binding protein
LKSFYQNRIDQLESDLGKIRTMMKEEMANGSGAKATELYNKAEKCEIELNNYQTRVDEINDEHIRRTSTTSG